MTNNFAEQFNGISNQILSTVSNLQKINNDAVQSLVNQQLSGVEGLISNSSRQLQELAQIKNPTDAAAAQLKIVNEIGESIVAQAKENMAILDQSRTQLEALLKTETDALMAKAKASSV
ncbi:MAG: phasin family protein [Magnetococcales bacterium]|nr:phasin family protein [Magnetococcales bacterium]